VEWIPVPIRDICRITALCLTLVTGCAGQASSPWRSWDTSDGFPESFISSVALTPGGSLWVKHGDLRGVDFLDGYTVKTYPDPGGTGKIECAPDGTLWIWLGKTLKRLDGSRWTAFDVGEVTSYGGLRNTSEERWEITSSTLPYYRAVVSLVALDRTHVLIMLPDRVLEFDAARSISRIVIPLAQTRLKRFLSMRGAPDGTVWLTGGDGIGRISRTATGPGTIDSGAEPDWQWAALPTQPAKWVDISEPFERGDDRLFVTGATSSQAKAALEFDGHRWKEIYSSDSTTLRAWPGSADTVWIQDGNRVLELAGGEKRMVERYGVLAGTPRLVTLANSGRFWVGSSEGLAFHNQPLWQTPDGAPQVDDVVNAISEDRSGNIWFLAAHELIRFDNSAWATFPLPREETAWPVYTEGPAALSDGRLVILTTSRHWLCFDPQREEFHVVEHPKKRDMRAFVQGPDGKVIGESYPAGSSGGMTLESFDGRRFRPVLGPGNLDDLRALRVRSNGEIRAGGNNFFGVYRDSPGSPGTVKIGRENGYLDPAPITSSTIPPDLCWQVGKMAYTGRRAKNGA
jgi:hypothetical protein